MIISGERRYRAAIRAGLTTLLCVESRGSMTADEILEDQLVENCVREDLKPIEQAKAFKALIDRRGCSYPQLAEMLNTSHMAVSRALSLLELPGEVQDRVSAGKLSASVAVEVSKLDDPEEQRVVAARVVSEGLNRAEAVEVVRRAARGKSGTGGPKTAKGRGDNKIKAQATRVFRTGSRIKITAERARGIDPVALASAFREILEKVEAEEGPTGNRTA